MSTATERASEAAAPPQQHPKLPPSAIRLQAAGQCWTEWELRLPKGRTLAEIYEDPSVFSAIQGSRLASLKRLDRLRIVPFDESFVCECFITGATDRGVNLSKPQKTEIPARTEALFQDGTYRIEWNGTGYHVLRMADLHVMTGTLANQSLALRALQDLYPKSTAA
jgi:hypothetical protein